MTRRASPSGWASPAPAIANALRLLALPEEVLAMLEDGSLSAGHARALLTLPGESLQVALAKRVAAEGLSVRQTEALARRLAKEPKEVPPSQGGQGRHCHLPGGCGKEPLQPVRPEGEGGQRPEKGPY